MDEEAPDTTCSVKWSARKQATEFIKSVTAGVVDFTMGRHILARPEIRINRLTECYEPCEHYDVETERCRVCNCKVKSKTAVLKQRCPKGKW